MTEIQLKLKILKIAYKIERTNAEKTNRAVNVPTVLAITKQLFDTVVES